MGRLKTAVFGTSTAKADRFVELCNRVERSEATRDQKQELKRLDNELPEHLKRQIQRERG